MKLIITNIAAIILIVGCSASVKNIRNEQAYSDSLSNVQKAQDYFIQGSLAEFNGDYSKAIVEYQEALSLDPSAGIHFSLSKNYVKLNKLSSALSHAKSAVKLEPENSEYLMQVGTIHFLSHQLDSAAMFFEKVIDKDSSNYQAYFYLGQTYEEKKPLSALKVYNKLLDQVGAEWDILVRVAELNTRLGYEDKTIETIKNLIKLDPTNQQLQKFLIEALLQSNKYDEAIDVIDKNLISFPDDLELIEYKAKALFSLKRINESVNEYIKLVNNPDLEFSKKFVIAAAFMNESSKDSSIIPFAYDVISKIQGDSVDWQISSFLGELALKQKKDSLAVMHLKNAINKAEWNSQLYERTGIILFDLKKYNELQEFLIKPAEKFQDNFVINLLLGLSLGQMNKHEQALSYLQKSAKLNPNDITALHALGFTLQQLKRNSEAIPYLMDALKIQPNNIEVLSTLGLVYESLKNWKKSDSLYENILIKEPDNALVLNNYAYSLSERGDSLEYAFKMSKKAIDSEPENASYLDTFGWIHFKLGNYKEAEFYIKKAIDKEPDNSTLHDHLGDVYQKLNIIKKAVESWKKALQLDNSRKEIQEKILKVQK
ncbi:MAG: tetratricopeptide repeat protein [Ignavibacteriales bacterium]